METGVIVAGLRGGRVALGALGAECGEAVVEKHVWVWAALGGGAAAGWTVGPGGCGGGDTGQVQAGLTSLVPRLAVHHRHHQQDHRPHYTVN